VYSSILRQEILPQFRGVENIDGEPKKSIIIVSDYKTVDGNL
jgi:hypothetical protein